MQPAHRVHLDLALFGVNNLAARIVVSCVAMATELTYLTWASACM